MKNPSINMKLPFGSLIIFLVFFSHFSNAQTVINSENFESGWGIIWRDGGNRADRINNSPLNGSWSVELTDNSGERSSIKTYDLDFTLYESIDLQFDYRVESFEGVEDFFVEFSDDGGSNWTTLKAYTLTSDFFNGVNYLNELVSITSNVYSFTNRAQFRIRCDAGDNSDIVYIDNIIIRGNTSTSTCCTEEDVDFDGVDDYILTDVNLSGSSEFTMMAWVKLDDVNKEQVIIGQDIVSLYVTAGGNLGASIETSKNNKNTPRVVSNTPLQTGVWTHVALRFNSNYWELELYINGVLWTNVNEENFQHVKKRLYSSSDSIEIGKEPNANNQYFDGNMVEVKVFNKGLTSEEIQHQVYQQIEDNNGDVFGVVVPRVIGNLAWDDLELYLKLEPTSTGKIDASDFSNNSRIVSLNGMSSVQETNAPLPFIAISSGDWQTTTSWEFGDVWNVETIQDFQPWAIVELLDNVELNSGNVNIALFGLKIPETSKFTMDGTMNPSTGTGTGYALTVSDYLKLDGVLDLEGESQLFQDSDADNVVGANGYLERDQQGTLDKFTYNYWSSPVSENGSTYSLENVLPAINWIYNGLNGVADPLSIAEYWIWIFRNGSNGDYRDWFNARSTGAINIGEGYTMKGPGSGVDQFQNYSFQGIPNNGDISLPISAGSNYLVGNPYPSAIDADQFIDDNETVLRSGGGGQDGALLFWEHWGGGTHYLSGYQGGYSYYTKSGGIAAVSHPKVYQGGSGVKIPGRYIPVGQGFFVASGNGSSGNGFIQFNNNQRVFRTEANPSNSLFMKSEGSTDSTEKVKSDSRMKIRLGVDMPGGFHRQLLVTVDERTTDSLDFGFSAKLADNLTNDMYWFLQGEKLVIQGIPTINKNTEIPLGFTMKSAGTMKIGIDELANIPANMSLYIKELSTGDTFELTENTQFEVELEKGTHNSKYALVFHPKLIAEKEVMLTEGMTSYLDNSTNHIHIAKIMNTEISGVQLFNLNGQLVNTWNDNLNANEVILPINLNTGVYLLRVETSLGVYSKKLLKE